MRMLKHKHRASVPGSAWDWHSLQRVMARTLPWPSGHNLLKGGQPAAVHWQQKSPAEDVRPYSSFKTAHWSPRDALCIWRCLAHHIIRCLALTPLQCLALTPPHNAWDIPCRSWHAPPARPERLVVPHRPGPGAGRSTGAHAHARRSAYAHGWAG